MNSNSIPSLPSLALWSRDDGTGPTHMGNLFSIAKTSSDAMRDLISWREQAGSPSISSILNTRSKLLSSTVLIEFFNSLQPKTPVAFEYSAYLLNIPFTSMSYEGLDTHLRGLKARFDNETTNQISWVIPVNIKNLKIIELSHIAVIVVRGKTVFYYDSKGISAKNRAWDQGKTIDDALKLVSIVLRPGVDINFVENHTPHQFDIHNCGLYVCLFVESCLLEGLDIEAFQVEISKVKDLYKERERILQEIKSTPLDVPTLTETPLVPEDDF